jgi:hypothetical protein
VFQHDPDGELIPHVLDLRTLSPISIPAIKEDPEDKQDGETFKTFELESPREKTTRQQKTIVDNWIDDIDHPVTQKDRHPLELYAQLTDDEFLYVQELQRVYNESRCYFVQWLLSKETKELVNGTRISAVQRGKRFTWKHTRAEILKSLTDVTLTARFLALSRLKRKNGSTAKFWISQVLTRRALLEDPRLPAPIHLPESLYLELTVGQMSNQETTLFECPCIGDDLNAKDRSGNPRFTLERLRGIVEQCSNPSQFRGVKPPITNLLEEPKINPKDPRDKKDDKDKDNKRKLNARANEKKDDKSNKPLQRPAHELPASFPKGLKRPDLTATVDGKLIASEFRQKLYDDIRHGNCVRCHAKGHARASCKEPAGKWEKKFDKAKEAYWNGTLKYQQKALAEKNPTKSPDKTKSTTPPTLVQKDSRRQTLAPPPPIPKTRSYLYNGALILWLPWQVLRGIT